MGFLYAIIINMRTTIELKEGTVLSKKGDGHILVYSSSGDYYYAVTMAELFRYMEASLNALKEEYTAKVAELTESFEAFKDEMNKKIEEMDKADAERDEKVSKMILNYQESMEKVFSMIQEVTDD